MVRAQVFQESRTSWVCLGFCVHVHSVVHDLIFSHLDISVASLFIALSPVSPSPSPASTSAAPNKNFRTENFVNTYNIFKTSLLKTFSGFFPLTLQSSNSEAPRRGPFSTSPPHPRCPPCAVPAPCAVWFCSTLQALSSRAFVPTGLLVLIVPTALMSTPLEV